MQNIVKSISKTLLVLACAIAFASGSFSGCGEDDSGGTPDGSGGTGGGGGAGGAGGTAGTDGGGGSAGDGAISDGPTREGRGDVFPEAITPTPNVVMCGDTMMMCNTITQVCCQRSVIPAPDGSQGDGGSPMSTMCEDIGACPASTMPRVRPTQCDGPEDCPSGTVCCESPMGGTNINFALCMATCDAPSFIRCNRAEECPSALPRCCRRPQQSTNNPRLYCREAGIC